MPKRPKPDVQIDSHFSHEERERVAWDGSDGYVMGSADGEYGHVSGFRYGLKNTGFRQGSHGVKASSLRRELR